jgi:hypothetical protein
MGCIMGDASAVFSGIVNAGITKLSSNVANKYHLFSVKKVSLRKNR